MIPREPAPRVRTMDNQRYNVILEGTLHENAERRQVVRNLALVFKKDEVFAEKLLSGRPRTIRKDVDRATADKYRKLIEKAGARARIEPVASPSETAIPRILKLVPPQPEPEPRPEDKPTVTCPRCGYEPQREDDVLIVRGDCPRCGFMGSSAARSAVFRAMDDEDLGPDPADDDFYRGRIPAISERRITASLHTLSLFLGSYCAIVLLKMLVFVPVENLPRQLGFRFFETTFTAFPELTFVFTAFIVCFIVPLALNGRTWGQKQSDIEVLYTQEAQVGGLIPAWAFRAAAIILLSVVPGMIVLWVIQAFGKFPAWYYEAILYLGTGALAWTAALVYGSKRPDERGVLDLAAGTIQVEENILPLNAVRRALMPFLGVVILIALLGFVLPLVLKLLGVSPPDSSVGSILG